MARPIIRFFIQSSSGLMPTSAKHNARLLTVLLKEGYVSDEMFKCSGKLECGHCVVEMDPLAAGEADQTELMMLAASGKGQEGYRCSCQLRVSTDFEGKVVRLVR